jgi:hypothetical protein
MSSRTDSAVTAQVAGVPRRLWSCRRRDLRLLRRYASPNPGSPHGGCAILGQMDETP